MISKSNHTLVIVGGGMVSNRLVQSLLTNGYQGSICWVGAESVFGYNRVLLPDHLSGKCTQAALGCASSAKNLHQIPSTSVVQIDRPAQQVLLSDGQLIGYQQLILATGGTAPRPDCEGADLPGTLTLRSLEDCAAAKARAAQSQHACVIGGGLLGLEAGKALLELGLSVQIIHRRGRLLNRQLDSEASRLLAQSLQQQGFSIRCNAQLERIEGHGQCEAIVLQDGTRHPADLVVFATGTRPDVCLAEQAGLKTNRGITTSDLLQTSDPAIFAIGECAEVAGLHYALVEPIYAQADALARTLGGSPTRFEPPANSTRLKVAGIALFAAGSFTAPATQGAAGESQNQDIVIRDSRNTLYRRLHFFNDRLTAAVLLGEIAGSRAIANAMHTTISCPSQRQQLAFGATLNE